MTTQPQRNAAELLERLASDLERELERAGVDAIETLNAERAFAAGLALIVAARDLLMLSAFEDEAAPATLKHVRIDGALDQLREVRALLAETYGA